MTFSPRTSIAAAALAVALAFAPPAQAQDTEAAGGIVSVLQADGSFTVLLGALESAGLLDALETGGPFTLFAPDDEAFAALPEGTLDVLTAEQVGEVLRYHLVEGNVASSDAAALPEATTALGAPVTFRADAGTLYVNDAPVTRPDLAAANGTIHVVGAVLLPFEAQPGEVLGDSEEAEEDGYEGDDGADEDAEEDTP